MTLHATPHPTLSWRDLACLPWFVWLAGAVIGLAGRVPRQAGDGSVFMPALLIALAALPGFVLIWSQRPAWLIRRGWWIPLLAMLAGGVVIALSEE